MIGAVEFGRFVCGGVGPGGAPRRCRCDPLVQVTRKSDDAVIATYTYDALGRRIRKVITNEGLSGNIANTTTDYLYDGMQCIEERDETGEVQRQYIWGRYVDELLQLRDFTGEKAKDYYPLTDLLHRSVALTNKAKNIVETYDTDAYGNTWIYDGVGDGGWFEDDTTYTNTPKCEFIYTGRRYDPETEIYYYRARYYHPQLARFTAKDPIDYRGGMGLYEYVRSAPGLFLDPAGRQQQDLLLTEGQLEVKPGLDAGTESTFSSEGLVDCETLLEVPLTDGRLELAPGLTAGTEPILVAIFPSTVSVGRKSYWKVGKADEFYLWAQLAGKRKNLCEFIGKPQRSHGKGKGIGWKQNLLAESGPTFYKERRMVWGRMQDVECYSYTIGYKWSVSQFTIPYVGRFIVYWMTSTVKLTICADGTVSAAVEAEHDGGWKMRMHSGHKEMGL
jgi:RHS repeat-associated protein